MNQQTNNSISTSAASGRSCGVSHRALTVLMGVMAAATAMLGGCETAETYTYVSTPHQPQTVTLLNTATGESVFTCDIPVGEKLDLRFNKRAQLAEEMGYDEMTWSLSGSASEPKGRKNTLKVPPASGRRLELHLREIPELPKK